MKNKIIYMALICAMACAIVISGTACSTGVDKQSFNAVTRLLTQHGPALKAMILEWGTEQRAPTTEEIKTIMQYWSVDEQALSALHTAVNNGMSTNGVVELAFKFAGLNNIGEIIGGYQPGSGYDPRLEVITRDILQTKDSLREINNRLGVVEDRIDSIESDLASLREDFALFSKQGSVSKPVTDQAFPVVKDLASLQAFAKKLWGDRYNKPASSREELEQMCGQLRDAIIARSNGQWQLSWGGRPDLRPDMLCGFINDQWWNIDMFISWDKGGLVPSEHLWWNYHSLNDRRNWTK